jgi:pimeloyl-ACP methyl ester carboxylesterase
MPALKLDGAVISYARAGSGPPVLLVQGVGVVGNGWKPQVDGLSDRFTLLSFDNRGIGASPFQGKPSIEAMAADALAIADAEGVERFHVAGAYLKGIDREQLAENLAPLFGRDLAEQPPIVMAQVRAMSRFDASARLAELSPIPTLVVSAAEDRIAKPEYGRALAAAIPGARYVEIPAAGHGVPIQLARNVNEILAEHWASVTSPTPSAAPRR